MLSRKQREHLEKTSGYMPVKEYFNDMNLTCMTAKSMIYKGISSAIDAYLESDLEELDFQSDEEVDQSDEEVDIGDICVHKCCIAEVNLSSTTYPLLNFHADTPRTKFNKYNSFNINVDTGCTTSSTGFKEDFIPESLKQILSTITGNFGQTKNHSCRNSTYFEERFYDLLLRVWQIDPSLFPKGLDIM
jgi:hypothetical protein